MEWQQSSIYIIRCKFSFMYRKRKAARTMRQNRPLLHGRFPDQNDVDKYIDIFSPSTTNNVIIHNKHNSLFLLFLYLDAV